MLAGGPYYLRRRMVYTTPWEPGFDTTKVLAKKMACWLDLVVVDPLLEGESWNMLSSVGVVIQFTTIVRPQPNSKEDAESFVEVGKPNTRKTPNSKPVGEEPSTSNQYEVLGKEQKNVDGDADNTSHHQQNQQKIDSPSSSTPEIGTKAIDEVQTVKVIPENPQNKGATNQDQNEELNNTIIPDLNNPHHARDLAIEQNRLDREKKRKEKREKKRGKKKTSRKDNIQIPEGR
ncbi:hypothetical protein R1sor_018170 [Riccia sorocarpa]|uniref:Uncharacterized protein n=1 Tax=Riccia sorocarpa TaxID=122646 RepID=A0ABD3I8Y6_9MARC